jgi:beta-lactamase class A
MEDYVAKRNGVYGVVVRDLATGETTAINAERVFRAASTYKLLVMYRVFRLIESGSLAMDDTVTISQADAAEEEPGAGLSVGQRVTVAEALEAMITVSSNQAAYALARTSGGWSTIEQAAAAIGMERTSLGSQGFETTAADMLLFLEGLSGGKLIDEEASAQMLSLLRGQTVNDRLPAALPPEAMVAHKTGELPGVRHDVGIVEGPGGRFAICVLTESVNEEAATLAIAEIARRAYERYGR